MIARTFFAGAAAVAVLAMVTTDTAIAQDGGIVLVTGARQDRSATNAFLGSQAPAIGLTRRADYFVTPVYVGSDTRDGTARMDELYAMLEAAITEAASQGVTLVAGQYTLAPVTVENMRQLVIASGNRPDTSQVLVYARTDLTGPSPKRRDAAAQIRTYVASIPATGRSFIETGATALAINNPEQYRGAVVQRIADEAKSYAAMFGSNYGITISGLDALLYWQQSSETDVFIYIEHDFTIAPR